MDCRMKNREAIKMGDWNRQNQLMKSCASHQRNLAMANG